MFDHGFRRRFAGHYILKLEIEWCMSLISILKHCVPGPLRPPVRRFVHTLVPSLRYASRVQNEINTYTGIENVHDLPAIAHYWSEKYVIPMLAPFGFRNSVEFFRTYIAQVCVNKTEVARILSVGAGNCATEINIAEWLRERGIENYAFDCVDINAEVLKRGQISASEKGLADRFVLGTFDINTWKPAHPYDVVLAVQSLHHFVELELLFEKINQALKPDGYFLCDDMIGRNGHQRWPEALKFVNQFWRELPDKYKYNHGLKAIEKKFPNSDCSAFGFEGIRAQDILPLLMRYFHFELFIGFGNIIDIFVDRAYGPNFDPTNEWDRSFIDRVQALDQSEIESGRVKPTHILAALTKQPVSHMKGYKHLSPEFCVRRARRWF
jgi:SAM-dependent methyltransferase